MSITVNILTMKKIIKTLIDVKTEVNIPMFLWGKHGVGKTSMVRQVANDIDYNCITLNFANIPIEDATGFPDGKGGYHKPEWLNIDNNKPTIYFCDEINRAPKYVLQGLFNFILEGRIHTHNIKPRDIIIVAGNPDCDEYETTIFEDLAFTSRFAHFYIEPDIEEYISYLKLHSKVHNSIINSIKLYYSEKLNNIVPTEKRIRTCPDNRSLEKIGKLMKILPKEQFSNIGYYIMAAMVNGDFATLLMTEYNKIDTLPSIEEIIKMTPDEYPFSRDDLDKLIIINNNLIKWLKDRKFNDETFCFEPFSTNKNENDLIRNGIKNYINFIPRDYQFAFIKDFRNEENQEDIKLIFGVGDIVGGGSEGGDKWLKELSDGYEIIEGEVKKINK